MHQGDAGRVALRRVVVGLVDPERGQQAADRVERGQQDRGREADPEAQCGLGGQVAGCRGCQGRADDRARLVVGDRRPAVGVDAKGGQFERRTDRHPEVHVADDDAGAGARDEGPEAHDHRRTQDVEDTDDRPDRQEDRRNHVLSSPHPGNGTGETMCCSMYGTSLGDARPRPQLGRGSSGMRDDGKGEGRRDGRGSRLDRATVGGRRIRSRCGRCRARLARGGRRTIRSAGRAPGSIGASERMRVHHHLQWDAIPPGPTPSAPGRPSRPRPGLVQAILAERCVLLVTEMRPHFRRRSPRCRRLPGRAGGRGGQMLPEKCGTSAVAPGSSVRLRPPGAGGGQDGSHHGDHDHEDQGGCQSRDRTRIADARLVPGSGDDQPIPERRAPTSRPTRTRVGVGSTRSAT